MRQSAKQMAVIADDVRAGDYASAGDRCEVLVDQMIEDGVDGRVLDLWRGRLVTYRAIATAERTAAEMSFEVES